MQDAAVAAQALGEVTSGPGLWALIAQAGFVVKLVMLSLLGASVWCWAVILEKWWKLRRLKGQSGAFEQAFWSGTPLEDLYGRLAQRASHPMTLMFTAAMDEWRETPAGRRTERETRASLLERIGRVMDLTQDRELFALERHLGSLATIGSTAPFVGLFGTVWGIMNSFQAIVVTKNTTLAAVAPGIAEALLATAMGLAAAIPAVVAYNKLSSDLNGYADRLTSFADEFNVVLARELEGPAAAA